MIHVLIEATEPVVGLTPERWDVAMAFMCIVVFSLAVLIGERL